jgi:hypothetical protein
MKKIALTITLYIISTCCNSYSQTLPAIQLDRPDQTECPFIVPVNHFQMESGFIYEKTNSKLHTVVSPTVLFKYGINNNTELRVITEIESSFEDAKKLNSGFTPMKIGFKTKICEEKGIVPTTSFIGHLAIPQKEKGIDFFAPLFRFTMQHTISKKISLGYNLGAEWNGESPEATFIYTLTSGYSLTDKLGLYVELYGFAPQQDKCRHLFDGGFTYLLKNNIMIDISGGTGVTPNVQNWFAALGFSIRLKD